MNILYTNETEDTLDYRVVLVNSMTSTTGLPVYQVKSLKAGASFSFTPITAGYYGIMSSAEGEDSYEMVSDYAVRFVSLGSEAAAIHNNGIQGFTILELGDFYKLKLTLTDDINSGVDYQNFMFEMLYAYVKEDDLGSPMLDARKTKNVPSIVERATRKNSSGVLSEYASGTMLIDDTIEYSEGHNVAVRDDALKYQHKMYFLGDECMIPKIPGQAVVGNHLIFALKRRRLASNLVGSMTGTYSMEITIETSTQVLSNLVDDNTVTKSILNNPGVYRSLNAAKRSTNTLEEVLYNKYLNQPIINDPNKARASISIPCGASTIDLYAVVNSSTGNDYTVEVIVDGVDTELSCSCSEAGVLVISSATDGEGNATSTGADVEAALKATENFNALFIVSPCSNTEIIEAMVATNLSGGVDGHKLMSTSHLIDSMCIVADEKPRMTATTSEVTLYGSTDARMLFECVEVGDLRNGFGIEVVYGSGVDTPLSVSVTDTGITISLATDGTGAVDTSGKNDNTLIVAAVNAHAEASLIVLASVTGVADTSVETVASGVLAGGGFCTPGYNGQIICDYNGDIFISAGVSTLETSKWRKILVEK